EDGTCVFGGVRDRDFLVHRPFDSFEAVETFVRQAATDTAVAGIKMTLYRIGEDSPLIDLLIDAADAGKQVAVLVELKARFDERNNIRWANRALSSTRTATCLPASAASISRSKIGRAHV